MYGWIWRHLPGPSWVRAIIVGLALAAIVMSLFTWVFPWISEMIPIQEQTVE